MEAGAGGGGVHASWFPRVLPGGAHVGQAPGRGAAACAGAGAAQGVGLRRLRHHPRLCAHCPPLCGRWPRGVGLGGGHWRALGVLVLLLALRVGHAGERCYAPAYTSRVNRVGGTSLPHFPSYAAVGFAAITSGSERSCFFSAATFAWIEASMSRNSMSPDRSPTGPCPGMTTVLADTFAI